MSLSAVLTRYVGTFVDALVRAGVREVCLCPGSRSTPLALTFARHPEVKVWTLIDERSAGYFALGIAKARGTPVALVATSGSAGANFFPAVLEAYYARVPLVVLTADRPHELRDCGAPQTIDQIRLYGSQVKWFVEMAPPEASEAVLAYARAVAARAAAVAASAPQGPVHLNFPFREPLVPAPDAELTLRGQPGIQVYQGVRMLAPEDLAALAGQVAGVERGLIVAGPQTDPRLGSALVELAEAWGQPILADPLSQVRCGPHDGRLVLDAYDAYLRYAPFTARFQPQVVLRFGAMPASKPLSLYLQETAGLQMVVDGGAGWRDPTGRAVQVIHADAVLFSRELARALREQARQGPRRLADSPWTRAWVKVDRLARQVIQQHLKAQPALFEGRVFAELAEALPEGATLFAGNSMPVRDLDTFFPASRRACRILANRGTNGIDGVVSTALGVAAASSGPTVLVVGDLSFYHDLNGLLAAKLHRLNLTVILIHNDGGGIFSFLPQAQEAPEHFEALFGTPTGLDFRPAVEMYGGSFHRVRDWADFREAVQRGLRAGGLHVVELSTHRQENVARHREVWQAVSEALEKEFPGLSGDASGVDGPCGYRWAM